MINTCLPPQLAASRCSTGAQATQACGTHTTSSNTVLTNESGAMQQQGQCERILELSLYLYPPLLPTKLMLPPCCVQSGSCSLHSWFLPLECCQSIPIVTTMWHHALSPLYVSTLTWIVILSVCTLHFLYFLSPLALILVVISPANTVSLQLMGAGTQLWNQKWHSECSNNVYWLTVSLYVITHMCTLHTLFYTTTQGLHYIWMYCWMFYNKQSLHDSHWGCKRNDSQ